MNYSNNAKQQKALKRLMYIVICTFILGFFTGFIISAVTNCNGASADMKVEAAPDKIEIAASKEPELKSLGKFKFTAYCSCSKCCGKSDGITATGTKATAGRTIAVDPKIIPLNSKVIIDGKEYTAEDVGGCIKGNKIDLYFESHQQALDFGVQYKEVFTYAN